MVLTSLIPGLYRLLIDYYRFPGNSNNSDGVIGLLYLHMSRITSFLFSPEHFLLAGGQQISWHKNSNVVET